VLARFYAPAATAAGRIVPLPPEEARHARDVLRLKCGDLVAVFDGDGHEFLARLERLTPRLVEVRLLESRTPVPELAVELAVALAVLKGGRSDQAVRDATLLGATYLQPLLTDRVVLPRAAAGRIERRWRQIAIAACKQCGRATVPRVQEPIDFDGWIAADGAARRLLLVEPGAAVDAVPLGALAGERPRSVSVTIGPEGGWTREEVQRAQTAGYQAVRLGPRTLRAEIVPVVALSVLLFLWGEL
jgi:16S rRNA (uracil1498-N3)-methyltransferase